MTSSDVLFCPQQKYIQFTVIEEERSQKVLDLCSPEGQGRFFSKFILSFKKKLHVVKRPLLDDSGAD